jgi:hypothetical protein
MKMDKVDDFEEQFYFDQGCLGRMVVNIMDGGGGGGMLYDHLRRRTLLL